MTAELLNVLVRGGRIIHLAPKPRPHEYDTDGRWWRGATNCPGQWTSLREATVADLDTKPHCRHCCPPDTGGQP